MEIGQVSRIVAAMLAGVGRIAISLAIEREEGMEIEEIVGIGKIEETDTIDMIVETEVIEATEDFQDAVEVTGEIDLEVDMVEVIAVVSEVGEEVDLAAEAIVRVLTTVDH
jgi:hypothetical protein